jgi:branched-chain amino acid transport system ATP-binding protein
MTADSPRHPGQTILAIENLTVAYGAIKALQDISLHIAEGEIVTLIGSNGAGKSTLLRTISGLLKPIAGSIIWRGSQSLLGLAPHQIVREGISHAPEGRQVFANLTVRENLLLGAYQQTNLAEIHANLQRIYDLFPVLHERRQQRSGTLSGGEQQMLAIGRCLMAKPRLLLLDEPSLGLAPIIVRRIFQIIRQINQEGTTIFLVEQNAHMALQLADRAYVLQTGRIALSDTASALLNRPEVKAAYLGG